MRTYVCGTLVACMCLWRNAEIYGTATCGKMQAADAAVADTALLLLLLLLLLLVQRRWVSGLMFRSRATSHETEKAVYK